MPEGHFPQKNPAKEKHGIGKTGICLAQTKNQIDPALEQCDYKEQIPQPPWPEWTEKSVKQTKAATNQKSLPQVEETHHPSSRCQKPVERGSSYTSERI